VVTSEGLGIWKLSSLKLDLLVDLTSVFSSVFSEPIDFSFVQYLHWENEDLLVLCYECDIVVINYKAKLAERISHDASFTSCAICQGINIIATIDDDGNCILWDMVSKVSCFKTNVSEHELKHIAYSELHLIVVTADGLLLVFRIHISPTPTLEPKLSIDMKTVSNGFCDPIELYAIGQKYLVGFATGVFVYDTLSDTSDFHSQENQIFTKCCATLIDTKLLCIMLPCFSRDIHLIQQLAIENSKDTQSTPIDIQSIPKHIPSIRKDIQSKDIQSTPKDIQSAPQGRSKNQSEPEVESDEEPEIFSVFPTENPKEGSPLLFRRSTKSTKPTRKTKSINQPVTFHKSIKSSGYGSVPPVRHLFSKNKMKKTGSRAVDTVLNSRLDRTYPMNANVINQFQPLNSEISSKLAHAGAVLKVKYSADGSLLGSCSSDRSARVSKVPILKHKGDGTVLVGHAGTVNTIDFSYSSNLLSNNYTQSLKNVTERPLVLTSSDDSTARLWSTFVSYPLAIFSPSTSVSHASFYYMDKFVVLASGSQVSMYSYNLEDIGPADDLKAQQRRNKQRQTDLPNQAVVSTWDSKGEAHNIIALATVNSFLSHLLFVARSDRTLAVIDASSDKVCRLVKSNRPSHNIALPTSSSYSSHPTNAYDMFVTSSTDLGGCLSLWDLRTQECVKQFTGHKNRSQNIGANISPCMRFIATGSEDNSCYIYDIRMENPIERLWDKHKDTVSDVSFHPISPYLVTACNDGKVRFYNSKTI